MRRLLRGDIVWPHRCRAGDGRRLGDPTLESAYYVSVGLRGETKVFLVQGRSVEEAGPVAIAASYSRGGHPKGAAADRSGAIRGRLEGYEP